jgi:hypothetical protein
MHPLDCAGRLHHVSGHSSKGGNFLQVIYVRNVVTSIARSYLAVKLHITDVNNNHSAKF